MNTEMDEEQSENQFQSLNNCDKGIENNLLSKDIKENNEDIKNNIQDTPVIRTRNQLNENKSKIDVNKITSCKPVSVDVTRLSSKTVPKKIVSNTVRKVRRRRYPWNYGILKKNNKNKKVQNSMDPHKNKKVNLSKNSLTNSNKENKDSDNESNHSEDVFDDGCCRRTLEFTGKLNTKELRTAYVEDFIKIKNIPAQSPKKEDLQQEKNNIKTGENKSVNQPPDNKLRNKNLSNSANNKNEPVKTKDEDKNNLAPKEIKEVTKKPVNTKEENENEFTSRRTEPYIRKNKLPKADHNKVNTNDKKISSIILSESKPDKIEAETSSETSESILDNKINDTTTVCRRVFPYIKKGYLNCSRTIPFLRPFNHIRTRDFLWLEDADSDSESNNEFNSNEEKVNLDVKMPFKNNLELKFKRKRRSSVDESQEKNNSKKMKSFPATPSWKSKCDKKFESTSSDKTICSFMSSKCTKHNHSHNNSNISINNYDILNFSIILTRLENMKNDPYVSRWLKTINKDKTESVDKLDDQLIENEKIIQENMLVDDNLQNILPEDNIFKSLSKENLSKPVSERKEISSESDENSADILLLMEDNDDWDKENISDQNNIPEIALEEKNKTNDCDLNSSAKDKSDVNFMEPSRPDSRNSTGSSLGSIKKPRRINYRVLSDSDSDASLGGSDKSNSHLRPSRSQAINAKQRILNLYEDENETDKEIEEFSKNNHIRSSRSKFTTDHSASVLNIPNQDYFESPKRRLRPRSCIQRSGSFSHENNSDNRSVSDACKNFENEFSDILKNNNISSIEKNNLNESLSKKSTLCEAVNKQSNILNESFENKTKNEENDEKIILNFIQNNYVKEFKDLKVHLIKIDLLCDFSQYSYSSNEIEKLTENYSLDHKLPFTRINYSNSDSQNDIIMAETRQDLSDIIMTEIEKDCSEGTCNEVQKSSEKNVNTCENNSEKIVQISEKLKTPQKTPLKTHLKTPSKTPIKASPIKNKDIHKLSLANTENTENQTEDSSETPESFKVNGVTVHTCTKCSKIFTDQDKLQAHVLSKHSEPEVTKPANATAKKTRRLNSSSDSLMCSMCSVSFKTKELLFDHIMTHTEEELQHAYKTAKAKKKNELQENNEAASKKNKTSNKNTNSPLTNNTNQNHEVNDMATIVRIPNHDLQQNAIIQNNKPVICSCHEHETNTLNNQDLQIEMVLQCKSCSVIYRRANCIEVHYRTNLECRKMRSNETNTKVPVLLCSSCPFILKSLPEMRTHLENHAKQNSQGTVTFLCNICKVAFFGVGSIFYTHWFYHTKNPDFVASRHSFPKLSVVSVLEDSSMSIPASKSSEGFFYIAEHVCRDCRMPFGSEIDLLKHKEIPCTAQTQNPTNEVNDKNKKDKVQMIKLVCDSCKKYYVSKDAFDRHLHDKQHLKTPPMKYSNMPINNNIQVLVCSICRNTTQTIQEMKTHYIKIHSPLIEVYTCNSCNEAPIGDTSIYSYQRFEKHCKLKHKSEVITCVVYYKSNDHVCRLCQIGFDNERTLKEHFIVHQTNLPQRSSVINTAPVPVIASPPVNPSPRSFKMAPKQGSLTNQRNSGTMLWVADSHIAPDGGRQIFPLHVKTITNNFNLQPKPNTVNVNQVIQDGANLTPGQFINVQQIVTQNSTPNVTTTSPGISDNIINQIPVVNTISSKDNNEIETILLDSRSNSPLVSGNNTLLETTQPKNNHVALEAAKKSNFMTIVNPNFESLLDSSLVTEEDSNLSNVKNIIKESLDKEILKKSESSPFEVVLLEDDNNSQQKTNENSSKIGNEVNNDKSGSQEEVVNKETNNESSSAKPFLRVRSVAELQKMYCSICNKNFDKVTDYEIHNKQHKEVFITPMHRNSNENVIRPQINLNNQMPMTSVAQDQPYWFSNSRSSEPISDPPTYNPYASVLAVSSQQKQMQQPRQTLQNNKTNSLLTNLLNHRQPPPYPGNRQNNTIQLSEQNNSTLKRPTGTAMRIPQVMPNKVNQNGNTLLTPYTCQTNSSLTDNSYIVTTAPTASIQTPVIKNYGSLTGKSIPTRTIYTCKVCNNFRSENPLLVKQHEKTHGILKPDAFNQLSMQQQQPQQQIQYQQIQQHQQIQQIPERTRHVMPTRIIPQANMDNNLKFVCRICNSRFVTNNELVEHLEKIHRTPTSQVCCYVCDYCTTPLIFESEEQLREHMDVSHNHSCSICTKRFPSKEDLSIHMSVHSRSIA